MAARTLEATAMFLRDQRRRPLLLILLVIVPAYVVTRSIAITEPTPRQMGLPGDLTILTTMRELHGAVMAGTTIAFVASLCGVFVMHSAIQGDRRLAVAGLRPGEIIVARMTVLGAATALVVAVSAMVTAVSFSPASWPPFLAAFALIGLIYAAIGALAGAVLDKLAATYLMLFLAMTDLGIVQNPMFGDGTPDSWAVALPAYGPARVMVDGAFSTGFHAGGELTLALAWVGALALAAGYVLRRTIAPRA